MDVAKLHNELNNSEALGLEEIADRLDWSIPYAGEVAEDLVKHFGGSKTDNGKFYVGRPFPRPTELHLNRLSSRGISKLASSLLSSEVTTEGPKDLAGAGFAVFNFYDRDEPLPEKYELVVLSYLYADGEQLLVESATELPLSRGDEKYLMKKHENWEEYRDET
jgi:hypothetical protein